VDECDAVGLFADGSIESTDRHYPGRHLEGFRYALVVTCANGTARTRGRAEQVSGTEEFARTLRAQDFWDSARRHATRDSAAKSRVATRQSEGEGTDSLATIARNSRRTCRIAIAIAVAVAR